MIKKIVLHNWMPFKGTQTITLPDQKTIHITGQYERNEQESNRSGKSSILQAIYFCLYGRVQTSSVHTDADDMYVKLVLSDGTILQKGTDGVWINGEKSTGQILTAYSERLLNMDDKMFLYTHCILNGDIRGMFNLSPKDQKQLLMDMSEFQYNWQDLYDISRERLSKINTSLSEYLSKIDYLNDKLSLINISDARDTYTRTCSELKARKQELEKFNKQEHSIFEQITKLKLDINNAENAIENIKIIEQQQKDFHTKKNKLQEEYNKCEEQLKNYRSITAVSNELKQVSKDLADKEVQVKNLTNQLHKHTYSKGMCPIMDTPCPESELLEAKASEWTGQIKELTEEVNKLSSTKKQLEQDKATVTNLEQQMHSIQQTFFMMGKEPDVPEPVEVYEKQITELTQKLTDLQGAFDSEFKERLINDVAKLDSTSKILESTIKSYESFAKEKEDFDSKSSALEDHKKIVGVATKLLSPHGLPYYLSAKVLTQLETYTNEFLEFMETSIYISPYKQLNTLEDYCVIDGYKYKSNDEKCAVCGATREKKIDPQITIYSADRGLPLDLESTGGKAIYYLALRFGLMKLLKSKGKILILDEIFANLDDINKERLMEMIDHATNVLGIEQIFIVSNDELKNILPSDITVIRHANFSTIE